jgi:tRNA(Ile)-lysidine synthase
MEFLQRVQNAVEKRRLFSRRNKILVAVSGGVDSMVLLHALKALAAKHRWQIFVAHFNHRLRGRASEADEKLVRQTAAKLQLKFFSSGADVKAFAAQSKISVEMTARKLRHEFLAGVAKQEKIKTVALAHHADDQAELFFLRLLRGAGGEGMAGMKWRSPSPADKSISLVRPLLEFSKAELLAFAREDKIPFREDATNLANDFLRNRIRNELLPLLREKYQPAVDKTILRLMDIVGAEAAFVGATAAAWRAKPEIAFTRLPVAVQRRVLQSQLAELGVVADFDLIEQLRTASRKAVSVGAGLVVARDAAGKIQLVKLGPKSEAGFHAGELKFKLSGGVGRVEFAGQKFFWTLEKSNGSPGHLPRRFGAEFFDADKIGGDIILRHWRAGDRFQPIGMKSAVKLQDLFVNAKIPAMRRRELVLAATAGGEIFWVEGLRIGDKFKLMPETKRQLRWKWSKITA